MQSDHIERYPEENILGRDKILRKLRYEHDRKEYEDNQKRLENTVQRDYKRLIALPSVITAAAIAVGINMHYAGIDQYNLGALAACSMTIIGTCFAYLNSPLVKYREVRLVPLEQRLVE